MRVVNRMISIPVGEKGETSSILSVPLESKEKTGIIVAHGAGNDMNTPLIASFAEKLALYGYTTLRFNFLYKERGKKTPDRQETLVETWQAVYRFARETLAGAIQSWVAAGKSMGGRVASQMVAGGLLPVERLIFLGYPLHPADDKEKLRDTHLYEIEIPMLFIAGTRDPLCDMGKLRTVLNSMKAPWNLHVIEGGDHSFHVAKSLGRSEEEIFEEIAGETLRWLSLSPRRLPGP